MISPNNSSSLIDKIKELRFRTITKKQDLKNEKLDKPVSFWIKKDRLLKEIGKEFAIVLRTKGCSWALSEKGGCSMCGYINDATTKVVEDKHILNQLDYAFQSKYNELNNSSQDFVLKIYNSGSFFDDSEITKKIRDDIYYKVKENNKIKELVIESRLEYVSKEKLLTLKNELKDTYIELAIGLETVDDYIRNIYINKGMYYDDFLETFRLCKEIGIGLRVYLLLKPPFLNEQGAIDDCVTSILKLINLGIDTISINPLNIQRNTFVEYLWYQNRYRPPWFYSLFKVLRKIEELNKNTYIPRLISAPSGAGTKRGIHNCRRRECNQKMMNILQDFVLTQDFDYIKNKHMYYDCECLTQYRLQKNHY